MMSQYKFIMSLFDVLMFNKELLTILLLWTLFVFNHKTDRKGSMVTVALTEVTELENLES